MANKLPDSGPISMLDVYNVLNPPMDPKDCDYYFETIEDFNSRRDAIIAENNNDLSQKTFGFGDGVTSLSDAFNTTKIISTPKMIVANNITNFRMCFDNCYSLTTIQSGLFDNCPNVIDFSYCFRNAYSLTTIPSDLFDNCLSITNLNVCFANCRRLTTIPQGLFDNCPNVTNFDGCFYQCTSLTTIPSDLFDKCPKVKDFTDCFYECIEITSAIPDAWNREKFPKVSRYSGYAEGCTKAANYNEIPSKFGGPSTNPPVALSENTINNTKSLVNNIRTANIPTSPISLNDKDFRKLAGISNGPISLRDFYGKGNTEHISEYVLLNERPYPNPWEGIPNRTASYNMQIPHKIIKGTLSVTISASKGGLSSSVKELNAAYVDVKNIGKVETKQGTKTQNFDVSNLSGSIPVNVYCGRLRLSEGKEYSYDTSVVIKFTGEWEA